jgi:hypothetical protein
LRQIESNFGINIKPNDSSESSFDLGYYLQFDEWLRKEAEEMAEHYAIFYCLENSIRELIRDRLSEEFGSNWWEEAVPEAVKGNAAKNRKREASAAVTPRSNESIDYISFGELGEIIKSNWDVFGDMFRDIQGLEKVLGYLNTLRAPIAHCNLLAEDEVVRLELSLKDWFRQMS